jgi:hypothetical protein
MAENDKLAHLLNDMAREAHWLADSDDARSMNEAALRLQD